jgi:hypothetical protein
VRYIQCLGEKAFSGWYTGSNGSGMKNEVIGTTCSMKKKYIYKCAKIYSIYIYRHATGTKGVDYKHLRQKTIHEAYRSLSST